MLYPDIFVITHYLLKLDEKMLDDVTTVEPHEAQTSDLLVIHEADYLEALKVPFNFIHLITRI